MPKVILLDGQTRFPQHVIDWPYEMPAVFKLPVMAGEIPVEYDRLQCLDNGDVLYRRHYPFAWMYGDDA